MTTKKLISTAMALAICATLHAQNTDTTKTDIDQWQELKEENIVNPFSKGNQFSIHFDKLTDTEWHYPLPGAKVISPYGGKRRHAGTDIKTRPNDTIYAAFPGKVVMSKIYYAYGNTVIIRHANGLETLYSHQSKNLVKEGQWVKAGHPIGLTGRTGRATTEHCHFETRVNGKTFDSSKLYDHANNTIKRFKFTFTKQPNGTVRISQE